MLHQNKGPGSLYIVKGGPDTIRYMDQRLLFDHIHQTDVLCKETYLAPTAAPSQTLVICALLNSIETSLQLQRFKVTKVRYMSQPAIAKFINYSPSDSVLIWAWYNLSSKAKTSLRGDLNELSHFTRTISRPYTYTYIATIVIKLRYSRSKGRLLCLRYKYSRDIITGLREALINISYPA